ncbi:MAG: tRNA dimethylallyltransferase 1 [Cyclobacteriaceae bacterium]|nr:MAG: tRNA dimethylallyltransferase 1 [Cyclobacteriaceae bacterium]
MKDNSRQLIVVLGPTASGKTQVAANLATRFGTEVISADSRQFYRELNIGVARPPASVLQQVTHHFIASHTIHKPLNAAQYAEEAHALLITLFTRHHKVVVCGGSGLYIKALLEGFDDIPEIPHHIRKEIQEEYHNKGLTWLQQELAVHDAEAWLHIDRNNPRRLMRALEVKRYTGKSIRHFQQGKKKNLPWQVNLPLQVNLPWQVKKIALDWPRDVLYHRINQRVLDMVNNGLFGEAERLYPHRHLSPLQTVGYEEIFAFMDGLISRERAIELIQRNTRRYAKRQLTWFRKDAEIHWVHPDSPERIFEIAGA